MRFPISFILLCFLLASSSSVARPAARAHARAVDSSYSSALAAANRFLHAWQTQDHETGIMMLTDAAREQASFNKLQGFFAPGEHAAYEILRGKRLNGGEFVFPVVLFGITGKAAQPYPSHLVIMRTTKDEWAVNRLP